MFRFNSIESVVHAIGKTRRAFQCARKSSVINLRAFTDHCGTRLVHTCIDQLHFLAADTANDCSKLSAAIVEDIIPSWKIISESRDRDNFERADHRGIPVRNNRNHRRIRSGSRRDEIGTVPRREPKKFRLNVYRFAGTVRWNGDSCARTLWRTPERVLNWRRMSRKRRNLPSRQARSARPI